MINDEEIKVLVTERLEYDPTVTPDTIEVEVIEGIVSLSGEVESRDDRKWIEVLVRQIPEIKDVVNYLAVSYDDSNYGPDVHHSSL